MNKKIAIAGWIACAISLLFAVSMGARSCSSKVKEPSPFVASSVEAPSSSSHKVGGPMRLGFDGGAPQPPISWLLVAPIQPPFGDATISGVEVRSIDMDLTSNIAANGAVIVHVASIGGDVGKTRNVILNLTSTQQTNFLNAIKAGTASSLGVTFQ